MNKYLINFDEACRWFLPEFQLLQFWHLQGKQLLKAGLNLDVFNRIAFFISSFDVEEMDKFYSNVAFRTKQHFIMDALDKYSLYTNFFAEHRERAVSLKQACHNATSEDELVTLLNYQLGLFKGISNIPSSQNLKKHETPLKNKNEKSEYHELIVQYKSRLY